MKTLYRRAMVRIPTAFCDGARLLRHPITDKTKVEIKMKALAHLTSTIWNPRSVTSALLLTVMTSVMAVTIPRTAVDGNVPAALTPGRPSGVYVLDSFEAINVYNGTLNVSIPVLTVGGRGEVSHTITVTATRPPWLLQNTTTGPAANSMYAHTTLPTDQWWQSVFKPGSYSPGMLLKRSTYGTYTTCPGSAIWAVAYTYLVWVSQDGSETPLYSVDSPQPLQASCSSITGNGNRGTVFAARDGSGMTAVLTGPALTDGFTTVDATNGNPSISSTGGMNGTLLMKNGLRYTIIDGNAVSLKDRHGNEITFEYEAGTRNVNRIVDALGRHFTILRNQQDGVFGTVDKIVYFGFAAANRVIRIRYSILGSSAANFRAPGPSTTQIVRDQLTISNPLFPQINGATIANFPAIRVPTAIFLNNADTNGQGTYKIQYNIYGEVARVELPTGGAVEYDHGPGLPTGPGVYASGQVLDKVNQESGSPSAAWQPFVYRRLKERRTYLNGGSSLAGSTAESTTEYPSAETTTGVHFFTPFGTSESRADSVGIVAAPYFTVRRSGLNVGVPVETRHHFYNWTRPLSGLALEVGLNLPTGGPANSLLLTDTTPGILNPFPGKEYKTEQADKHISESAFQFEGDGSLQACQENTTIVSGTNRATKTRLMYYDRTATGPYLDGERYSNLSFVYEYPFTVSLPINTITVTEGSYAVCRAVADPAWVRRTFTEYERRAEYIGAGASHLRALPTRQEVHDRSTGTEVLASESTTVYDESGRLLARPSLSRNTLPSTVVRGNPTTVTQTVNGDQASISISRTYDNAGNVVSISDARGAITDFDFADSFVGPPSQLSNNFSHLTLTTYPNPSGAGVRPTRTSKYDFWTGQVVEVTDLNGVATTLWYNDPLDRLTEATRNGRRTKIEYVDTPNATATTVRSDQYAADYRLVSTTSYDGFGRPYRDTRGTTEPIETLTEFDGLGRVWRQNLPRRVGVPNGYFTHAYDALGRLLTKTRHDGSQWATIYDDVLTAQGLKMTTRVPGTPAKNTETYSDALGRLVRVVEKGASDYITNYRYNALDKLVGVCQGGDFLGDTCPGGQQRQFTYDLLGRLRTATNPESGTTSYKYDANGNVLETRRADNSAVCFGVWSGTTCTQTPKGYDFWNRPVRKELKANGQVSEICYDGRDYSASAKACVGEQSTIRWGRLTAYGSKDSAGNLVSRSWYDYDAAGRLIYSSQVTADAPTAYDFQYAYHLDDSLSRTTFPSSKLVWNCYDDHGRLKWVSSHSSLGGGSCAGSPNTAPSSYHAFFESYSPSDVDNVVRLGNNRLVQTCTDDRQHIVGMRVASNITTDCNVADNGLGRFIWRYPEGGADHGTPDGHFQYWTDDRTGIPLENRTYYTLDALHRVTDAAESHYASGALRADRSWRLSYTYDQFGNRAVASATTFPTSDLGAKNLNQYSALNNRLVRSTTSIPTTTQDIGYDPAGQMIVHPTMGNFTYDDEGRIVTAGSAQYAYDADGKRVKKVASGATTIFVYDAFGALAYEYSTASAVAGKQYLVKDYLGSTRMVLDGAGSAVPVSRRDYFPFGDEIPGNDTFGGRGGYNAAFNSNWLFTGKERDAETGLDYFSARYYASALGRFTTPDAPLAGQDARDPQTWNLYHYGRANPLVFIDPSGRAHLPASPETTRRIKAQDPSFYDALWESPNYSPRQFEAEVAADGFSVNQLLGVAAEAVVLEEYKKTTIAEPQFRLTQGDNRPVDIVAVAPDFKNRVEANLHNIVNPATGYSAAKTAIAGPNVLVAVEVKQGSLLDYRGRPTVIPEAVSQILSTPTVALGRAIVTPVVAVDRGNWFRQLSPTERISIATGAASRGVRIQLFNNLNNNALTKADYAIKAVRR